MHLPKNYSTGQALVEFALGLVGLLLIIFLIVEGGRLFQGWVTVQNAARAGGRYAITGYYDPACLSDSPPCPDPRVHSIKAEARKSSAGIPINDRAGFGDPQYYQVDVFGINADNAWQPEYAGDAGKPVIVRVVYRMSVITPLFQPVAKSVRLVGQVTLNNENYNQVNKTGGDNTPLDLPPPPTPGPPAADLQLETAAEPIVVLVNKPLIYSLQVTNNGPNEARGITVVDKLPAGVSVQAIAPAALCAEAGGVVTCDLPNLPRGGVYDLSIEVTAPSTPPPDPGFMVNDATVTSAVPDPDTTNNSTTTDTLVVLSDKVADVELVGNDDIPDPVLVNQLLTYTIVVGNNGVNDATAVTVSVPIPSELTYVSSTPSSGLCTKSGQVVSCAMGNLATGETASVEIEVVAPSSAGSVSITASVIANEADPDPTNNERTEWTTVSPEWADLYVIMSDAPDPVAVGQDLVYSIIAGNNGPADGIDVTLADTLADTVTFVSASPTQGSCNMVGDTVNCSLGLIPSGMGANVTIVVKPTQMGSISNRATVSGSQTDPNAVNDTDTATTSVTPTTDLSITKSADPTSPPGLPAGEILTYEVVATNNGPSPATGVRVVDSLPVDVSFIGVTASQGSCSQNGITVDCNLGNLATGQSATINIEVVPQQAGVVVNSASVTGHQSDTNPVNNTARDTTTVDPAVDAFITLEPVCGDAGSSLVVNGFNWPSNGNKDVLIYWDSASAANLLGTVVQNGTVWSITVDVPVDATDGAYTILARRQNYTTEATFTVPCPAPNLVTSDPVLVNQGPVAVGDPVTFEVDISNIGDLDAISQFFVGLYFDPPTPPDATTTHLPQNYRAKLVAVSGLAIGASRTLTITADSGFDTPDLHDVYVVVDSDPGPIGVIDERSETDNISGLLQLSVDPGPEPTPPPPPTPGPSPTPTPEPDPAGSLIGQAFLNSSGGEPLPQPGVEVRVYDAGNGVLAGITYTDTSGSYFFSALDPGLYTGTACIIIDSLSYAYSVAGINVVSGQVTIEDLYLDAGPCS